MPDNLYCDQTTPWQGVYFFTNTVYREIDTLYMCYSNFIVLFPHISSWTQCWIQAFIVHVAYENLTFKSVKQNCCFRNQHRDAVKSRQALKKVESNRPIRMQYFLPEYIKPQSELVHRSTFFWLVYLQTSRHATQMNWINTNVLFIWDLAK